MKSKILGGLLGVALFFAALGEFRLRRAEVTIIEARDSIATLDLLGEMRDAAADSVADLVEVMDSTIAQQTRDAIVSLQESEDSAEQAETEFIRLSENLRESLDSAATIVFDSITSRHNQQVSALEDMLQTQSNRILSLGIVNSLMHDLNASKDSIIVQRDLSIIQRDIMIRALEVKPGWIHGVVKEGGKAVVYLAGGYLLGQR